MGISTTLQRKAEDRLERIQALSGEGDQPRALSFGEFLDAEFMPAVAEVEGDLVEAPHLQRWAEIADRERFLALVAFRGSLKSTFAKALVAHALREHQSGAFDGFYYSVKLDLAREHLRRLKMYLQPLAEQWGWRDATGGAALLRYEKPGALFQCQPEGLDSASRGRRADLLVIDDPADPRKLASMVELERAKDALQRRILPLLKDDEARVVFAGTPIVADDVVSWITDNPEFWTEWMPAIQEDGSPAWPEKHTRDELERIKGLVGERAFRSEYLLESVAVTDSYLDPTLIQSAIYDPNEEGPR